MSKRIFTVDTTLAVAEEYEEFELVRDIRICEHEQPGGSVYVNGLPAIVGNIGKPEGQVRCHRGCAPPFDKSGVINVQRSAFDPNRFGAGDRASTTQMS